MRIVQYEKWMRLRDGGVVNSIMNLSRALVARGHQVALLTADSADLPKEWRLAQGEDPFAPRSTPAVLTLRLRDRVAELRGGSAEKAEWDTPFQRLDAASMRTVGDVLRKAEVAHIHIMWTTSNLQVAAAARRARVPYVLSPHGSLDRVSMTKGALKKRLHLALFSAPMLRHARAIHCTSPAERDEGLQLFRNPNPLVIPLPFDTTQFHSLPGAQMARERFPALAGASSTALFLGRLHSIKNLERLIRAAARWRASGQHVTTVLAGPPANPEYLRSLEGLAQTLGVADRLVFTGMIDGPLKLSLYQAADVFLNLSAHENFSLVIIEAMCCGAPVVTTKQTGIWPDLEAGGGAFIVDTDDQLDRAVLSIVADPAERAQMSNKARAWALQYVDFDSVMSRYEAMYHQAMGA
jgi:glycosyltransferase involved in cell wall biosynthesis